MTPFVAVFLFFTMAMSVDNYENENKEATAYQHNEDRPVPPKLGNQVAKVWGNGSDHPLVIYIRAG